MSHINLFTGLAGFTLACHWNGIETEVMCEKDEKCRQFLERTWPGIPIVPDIREFDGTEWRGRFLLTGGVPCQPASRAGKQRGKADDRWLWPEAIRVVGEALPAWCLFENPPGIYDVGIDGILSDLEGIGYETGIVEIPACAINAPQIRQRVWIVAHTERNNDNGDTREIQGEDEQQESEGQEGRNAQFGCTNQGDVADTGQKHGQRGQTEQNTGGDISEERHKAASHAERAGDLADTEEPNDGRSYTSESDRQVQQSGISNGKGNMADTNEAKRQCLTCKQRPRPDREEKTGTYSQSTGYGLWSNALWLPCADGKLRRAPDDTFGLANGLHRSLLAALGNSIVPQVAYEIIRGIKEADGRKT